MPYLENCSATWVSTVWISSSFSADQNRKSEGKREGPAGHHGPEATRLHGQERPASLDASSTPLPAPRGLSCPPPNAPSLPECSRPPTCLLMASLQSGQSYGPPEAGISYKKQAGLVSKQGSFH